MLDWLRLLLMMFYAPARGMSEVRDRAPLAQAALLALAAYSAFILCLQFAYLSSVINVRSAWAIIAAILQSAGSLLFLAVVFVPIAIFIANLFERRASYGLVLRQEYAAATATLFYAWAAASLAALPLAFLLKASGLLKSLSEQFLLEFQRQQSQIPPDTFLSLDPRLLNVQVVSLSFSVLLMLSLFGLWSVIAVRELFRSSWLRAITIVLLSGLVMFPASFVLMPIFSTVLASPFLLLLLFFVLRGYFTEARRTAQARASFKQNLEAATLNPADASAHYNLGLIHQQRNELDAARQRFERAVEIDAEEVDAHYQLGRIARAQNRLPDAIKHFEQTVARDPSHAQHEVWREIGATYLAAGQFADARDALERFLEHRASDPEGLYLMGRAHAGLGHQHEAARSMQACIEAVKTAPAYKYRTDKRWLNEAQQFLRTQV